MRRLWTVVIIAIAVALQPAARGQTRESCFPGDPPLAAVPSISFDTAVATQDRFNRYFHHDIVPRMIGCWRSISGRGKVAVRFQFERVGDHWVAGASSVRNATLASGQEQVALRCLQQAMRGTSLPAADTDGESAAYFVNWSFPVPWPRNDAEAIVVALDDGNGGGRGTCGGPENPAACFDCYFIPILGWPLCVPACVGYLDCSNADGTSCRMSSRTRCITGGVFRNLRGAIFY